MHTWYKSPSEKKAAAPPAKPVISFRATILIADDDSHIREVARFSQNQDGYRTYEAVDFLESFDLHRKLNPDLIIYPEEIKRQECGNLVLDRDRFQVFWADVVQPGTTAYNINTILLQLHTRYAGGEESDRGKNQSGYTGREDGQGDF